MTTRSTDTQVRDLIITPMAAMYTPPRGMENVPAALAQYLAALRPYAPEALQGGWIALVAAHGRTTWPVPGEIIKHVRDWIHANVKPEGKGSAAAPETGKEFTLHTDSAKRAMSTDAGQLALSKGYGRILFQHVERHGWLEGFSHDHAARIDQEMRQTVADMEANGDGFGGRVLGMGKRRMDTEDQLKSKYLRRAAA